MTSGRRVSENIRTSRRLPPPEAWRQPDKWLTIADARTGYIKPDIQKLHLPTDDRNFVVPEQAVAMIKDLFWDDYTWPYDRRDPETAPDIHHFHYEAAWYDPVHFDDSPIPQQFRNLPSMLGEMPRQFHNTLHAVSLPPEVPSIDDMGSHVEAYQSARRLFKQLFKTAQSTVAIQGMFSSRREDIESNPDRIQHREQDEVGEKYIASQFKRQFAAYQRAVEEAQRAAESDADISLEHYLKKKQPRPQHVVRALGKVVNRRCINFVPSIAGKVA